MRKSWTFLTHYGSLSGFAYRINNTTCILVWKIVCDAVFVLAHFTSYTGIQLEVFKHSRFFATSVLARRWQILLSCSIPACLRWYWGT